MKELVITLNVQDEAVNIGPIGLVTAAHWTLILRECGSGPKERLRDWVSMPLPPRMYPVYYLMRPFRLIRD